MLSSLKSMSVCFLLRAIWLSFRQDKRDRSRASFFEAGAWEAAHGATSSIFLFDALPCAAGVFSLPATGPSPSDSQGEHERTARQSTGDVPRNPAGVTPAPHLPEWWLCTPV